MFSIFYNFLNLLNQSTQKMITYKSNIIIALISIAFASLTSCKKENTDTSKPIITVEEPSSNDTVSGPIHIEFIVTDNISLNQLTIKILNSSGTELFIKNPAVMDLKEFDFHEHYDASGITGATHLSVIITATDKSNNIETITIPIIAVP